MRPRIRPWLLALVLALLAFGGVSRRVPLSAPSPAFASADHALAVQPDLALHSQCGPDSTQTLLSCTFTVTNASSAPLVTTQANPVVLDAQLTVGGAQSTTVQAALSSLCPYNSASLSQVGTNNLAMITQNGTSNDLTVTQTGTNNFATVNQVGNTNVLVLNQTSTATSTTMETVHVTCGGATFAPGQTLSFTVSIGTCSQIAGAPVTITASVTPPGGATDADPSNNSFSGSFQTPRCIPPPSALTVPGSSSPLSLAGLAGITGSLTISVQGCGTTQPAPGGYFLSLGQALTITAQPCAGSRFTGWSDSGSSCDGTTINPCTVTFPMTTQITANFSP